MKFLDKITSVFRKKVDAKNDEVKKATEGTQIAHTVNLLSMEEREELSRRVTGVKIPSGIPRGFVLYRCRQGFYVGKHGRVNLSGPCPSVKGAFKTALRNFEAL